MSKKSFFVNSPYYAYMDLIPIISKPNNGSLLILINEKIVT